MTTSQPVARTMCELFQQAVREHAEQVAIRDLDDTLVLTWHQYGDRVRRVAAGLAHLGVGRGDTVGLMLANRPEFHLADAGAMHLGATPFSSYNTNTAEMIRFLLLNAGCQVVVTERQFLSRVEEAAAGTDVKHLVCVDADEQTPGVITLTELERVGDPGFDFESAWNSVQPEDVLTLIYTSGTTGDPKGVEITHANMLFSLQTVTTLAEQPAEARVISYLPDAHALNRYLAHYYPMFSGAEVTTLAEPKELLGALTKVRPTIFVSVPMLWYKLKATIDSRLANQRGPRVALARWALRVGRDEARRRLDHRSATAYQRLEYALAYRLALHQVAKRLGLDACTYAVTGAAPIAEDAMEFVLSLGIPLCEAWGMTEITAVATVNRADAIRPGTVGQAIPGVEVKIAADGELLVRSPGIMRGYRNEPELTARTVIDGWMHTGDVGTVDAEGYVRIIDRKKELIINSAGKNMSPARIENVLKMACPLIGTVVAIGDRRPFVTALIALDPDQVAEFAAARGLSGDFTQLSQHPAVTDAVAEGVARANEQLARVEQVRRHRVVDQPWEPAGDELTPTLKLRRRPISEKYADVIDSMYAATP
ncbi:AMP-dependent synthetase/ligase [Nocardioides pelophilus]|uniref:AMP-dependent synthetase/ligase n=1 Tax=Nocardioides pelophilus TaxID=2172019 RepID=UPI0016013F9A|nr:long-chain fatty acid--CoA ligase [Nocardioides pelophilus]